MKKKLLSIREHLLILQKNEHFSQWRMKKILDMLEELIGAKD